MKADDSSKNVSGFRTDYQFITNSKMRTIPKMDKEEKNTIVCNSNENRCTPANTRVTAILFSLNCQRLVYLNLAFLWSFRWITGLAFHWDFLCFFRWHLILFNVSYNQEMGLLPYSYCSSGVLVSFLCSPCHTDINFRLQHVVSTFLSWIY